MFTSMVLHLALAVASICIVQSANPTGPTGCSKRWVTDYYCYRYCDESQRSWCYTGNGCYYDETACAARRVCEGWCKASQISQGCVVDCPAKKAESGISEESKCIPRDEWKVIHSCNNLESAFPFKCSFEYKTGVERTNRRSLGGSRSNIVSTLVEVGGGINFRALSANFKASLGTNTTTGTNWELEKASSFNVERTARYEIDIPAHSKITLMQAIGYCGEFEVFGGVKTISERNINGDIVTETPIYSG